MTPYRIRRLPAFAAIAAQLFAPGGSGSAAQLPFNYEDTRIYVPVSSATGPLGWFILDTGVSGALIDGSLRERLGLPVLSTSTAHAAGQSELQINTSSELSLDVGGTELRLSGTRLTAISSVLAPFSGREIGGIIGGAFFREHVVTIDVAGERIELRDPKTYQYEGQGSVLHFRFVNNVPVADGVLTLPDGTKLSLRLLVDLGAKANLLIAELFVEQNNLRRHFTTSVVEPLGAGLGGETRYAFVRVPHLAVGADTNISKSDFVAGLSVNGTLRGGYYDALLGLGFLRHYRTTFDYARERIIFEPVNHSEPDGFDESGIFLTADPGKQDYTVHYIVPGSPAAEAGIKVGDVLRSIDGSPTAGLSLAAIRLILQGTKGPVAILGIAGQTRPVSIRLRPLV